MCFPPWLLVIQIQTGWHEKSRVIFFFFKAIVLQIIQRFIQKLQSHKHKSSEISCSHYEWRLNGDEDSLVPQGGNKPISSLHTHTPHTRPFSCSAVPTPSCRLQLDS